MGLVTGCGLRVAFMHRSGVAPSLRSKIVTLPLLVSDLKLSIGYKKGTKYPFKGKDTSLNYDQITDLMRSKAAVTPSRRLDDSVL